MPIAWMRRLNTLPKARALSRTMYPGALSQGNASVIWRANHSAVGCRVTANHNSCRRPWPRIRNAKNCSKAAVAQIDDDAAAGRLEARERGADRLGAAEHIADHVGAMQPRQHALAVANLAIDEGHVVHAVEWGDIGVAVERADF